MKGAGLSRIMVACLELPRSGSQSRYPAKCRREIRSAVWEKMLCVHPSLTERYERRRWQGLRSIIGHGRVGDDASGRVEAVHVEAEEQPSRDVA